MKKLLIVAVLVCAPGAAEAQVKGTGIDRIFAQYDRKDSPGCALGVVHNGQFVYQKGYGSANLDYEIPNSPDMVYYVGSVSKQFTAAAIALLVLDGRISLDDPVTKYIPEVAHLPRMTINQLVHHTAGVRDIYGLMSLAGIRMEDVFPQEDAIGLIARQRELNFAPGDDYLYSNSGYLFLGEIIKRVTGKSLREFADERIFKPLGMTRTHFHDEPDHVLKNRVWSYSPIPGGGYRISYLLNFDKTGAGGLYTTLGDLLKWDQNFYENKLGKGFLELMHTRGTLNQGDTLSYAFGLQIGQYRGLRTVGHSGSLMGFQANLIRFPDQKFSIIALCNASNISPSALSTQVADQFIADVMTAPVVNQPTRPAGAARPTPARPVVFQPADYVGKYYSAELEVTYTVEADAEGLRVVGGLPRERRLTAEDKDVFRAGTYVFRFQRDGAGRVTSFTIEAGRVRNIRFTRTQ